MNPFDAIHRATAGTGRLLGALLAATALLAQGCASTRGSPNGVRVRESRAADFDAVVARVAADPAGACADPGAVDRAIASGRFADHLDVSYSDTWFAYRCRCDASCACAACDASPLAAEACYNEVTSLARLREAACACRARMGQRSPATPGQLDAADAAGLLDLATSLAQPAAIRAQAEERLLAVLARPGAPPSPPVPPFRVTCAIGPVERDYPVRISPSPRLLAALEARRPGTGIAPATSAAAAAPPGAPGAPATVVLSGARRTPASATKAPSAAARAAGEAAMAPMCDALRARDDLRARRVALQRQEAATGTVDREARRRLDDEMARNDEERRRLQGQLDGGGIHFSRKLDCR